MTTNSEEIVQKFVQQNNLPNVIKELNIAKTHYRAAFKEDIANDCYDKEDRISLSKQHFFSNIEFSQLLNFIDLLNRYPQDPLYFTRHFIELNLIEIHDVVSDVISCYSSQEIDAVVEMVSLLMHESTPHINNQTFDSEELLLTSNF